jgi:diguanylate cyclase (GGDEF)-like protein
VAFVLVVVVPLLVGTVIVSRAFPREVQSAQRDGAVSSSRLVAQVLREYCDRARATAEAAGRAATMSTPTVARAAAASLVDRGLADGIEVSNAAGRVVVTAGEVPDVPTDCRQSSEARAHLTAVLPLLTAGGRPAGRAVASYTVSGSMFDELRSAVSDGQLVLVDQDGAVLAGNRSISAGVVRTAMTGSRQDHWVSGYAPPSAGQPLGVVVLLPAAHGSDLLLDATLVLLLAVGLAMAIAVASARATTRPLEELGDAAARIASGDLSTSIQVTSKDEVGRLATAFNVMTDELRSYVGQLEASRDELQSGLARLGDTLSSTHDLDRILHVVLESAVASTRATSGLVLLLTPSRDELVMAASQGLADAPLDLRVQVGEGITGRVAQSGDAFRGFVGESRIGEVEGAAVIAVPLKSSGTVIGVLDLFGDEEFDDTDLATIRTFASQATVAVDNVLLHEEAQRLSITDGLTGLWNYRYFTMMIAKEIERAARFARPLALIMLDLDHFKSVNDNHGHQRGDAVLVELAGRIRSEVRDVDTVARYGGEEVVIVLPETDAEGAAQLAERLCASIRRKPFGDPHVLPVRLTVSAGVAVFPTHGLSASALLAKADLALYEAKHAGRDTWRLATGNSVPH